MLVSSNVRIVVANATHIWGIETDADGIQRVVRYRVGFEGLSRTGPVEAAVRRLLCVLEGVAPPPVVPIRLWVLSEIVHPRLLMPAVP